MPWLWASVLLSRLCSSLPLMESDLSQPLPRPHVSVPPHSAFPSSASFPGSSPPLFLGTSLRWNWFSQLQHRENGQAEGGLRHLAERETVSQGSPETREVWGHSPPALARSRKPVHVLSSQTGEPTGAESLLGPGTVRALIPATL